MGRLVIHVDGSVRLDLSGSLMRFDDTVPVIWGVAEGIPVTLTTASRSFSVALGLVRVGSFKRLHARRAYVGAHFHPRAKRSSAARGSAWRTSTGFLAAPVVNRMVDEDRPGLVAAVSGTSRPLTTGSGQLPRASHADSFRSVESRATTTGVHVLSPRTLHLTPPEPVAVDAFNGLIQHLSDLMTPGLRGKPVASSAPVHRRDGY